MAKFNHIISAADTHAGGEPTRIVLSGLPYMAGQTMTDKKEYMAEKLDHFRQLLMQEPRGHRDMFGAVITPPASAAAQHGVLFMDNGGYLDMCGHGIISVVTALIETGVVGAVAPETIVTLDTPAGAIECIAQVRGDGVSSVSMRNVPAFVFAREVSLELPEIGQIHVDIAFGGNFFALVSAPAVGIQLVPSNTSKLSALGLTIREMVNEKVEVLHPTKPHITRVALTEFYETPDPVRPFLRRNVTVFGRGQVDRSPCGTGTSAAMALLNEKGALPIGVEYVSESIIGTRFTGTLTGEGEAGTFRTVTPMITGEAFITGLQQFIVDPDDPIPYGFALD